MDKDFKPYLYANLARSEPPITYTGLKFEELERKIEKNSVRSLAFWVHTGMKGYKHTEILDVLFKVSFKLVHVLVFLCLAAMMMAGIFSYTREGFSWLIELIAFLK